MNWKVKLVDDWRSAWKWISMNCMVMAVAIQGTWLYLPDDMRLSVPSHIVTFITLVLLVLGAVGRMVKQGGENK